jgi:hypothetical protein
MFAANLMHGSSFKAKTYNALADVRLLTFWKFASMHEMSASILTSTH